MRLLPPTALAWLLVVALGGCGYRPAADVLRGGERTALVPAFDSYLAYPELAVYSGSYLASRLVPMGVRPSSDPTRTDCTIQGYLLAVRETPLVLSAEQTLVELVVDVRIEVLDASGAPPCQTRVAHGRSTMAVPLTTVSEAERQTALQAAASEAIDALLLETLLCAADEGS